MNNKQNCAQCGKDVLRYLKPEDLEKGRAELAKMEDDAVVYCTAFCYQKMFGMREDPLTDPLLRSRIDNGTAMKPII